MRKIFKIIAIIIGVLILIVLFLAGGLILYTSVAPSPDPKSYNEYWPENLTYAEADEIAVDLVSQMTFEEKLGQMTGDMSFLDIASGLTSVLVFEKIPIVASGENERLNIPPFTFTDGPRGVVVTEATAFPVAMARGATWDRDLEFQVGDAIGKEARAAGANYFGGVCINLLRHPAWGRAQETFGEDPWHLGKMGVSLINGVQQHNVMACAKHYALNSIEESRFKVDVSVDERTLREVYLPHFKMAVDADVASIMSAYNKVRGEFAGQNRYLLTDILRNEWNFEGFVTSDWLFGLRDGVKGVNAGLDIEMPLDQHYTPEELKPAIESGEISIDQIDEMVRRVVRTKLLYITNTDTQEYTDEILASEEHQQLALEVAEKSMVLLKNDDDFLPLSAGEIESLAVIGEIADSDHTGDRGSSGTHPPYIITMLKGLQDYSNGSFEVIFDDGTDIESARQAAERADAVVYVVGYKSEDEGEYITSGDPEVAPENQWGEGGDRPNLFLKPHDQNLLMESLPVNQNSVVTLIGGSGIMTNTWDQLTPSILMAWYPGMMGGEALANILFGKVNPSGKLPLSIPKDEEHLSFFQADIDSIHYGYYHGYTLLDKENNEPAYPFGFGLSYSNFEYSNLQLDKTRLAESDTLLVSVDVTNTGEMTGEEVVQLYIGFENSMVERPVKLLRGFEKERLNPRQTKTVSIPVAAKDLAWYNPDVKAWEVENMQYSVFIGGSSNWEALLQSDFTIQ
ncbi:beta-glucosidase family protein [Rhodohalobacter sulfatireducens]|uniref:Glycoside hydrolase family 3 C-terminal domain-containing protein n=1 Tax=Rhodohalobacter sulfatireducens TaxID=2911366 RepID=A0ABS9KFN9_9BACT|nr:glycoside hydrolase family 3 N-terminal domain-containing protein [Rhodohalobacter sulfatireducens]MCG2589669.1 glycoside hydrolase family 3 C-terminal domain-containing protein [Rhodohalobacter sulfatireducens]